MSRSRDEATEAFDAARDLAAAGKYEEALEKLVWFHDHALEIRPSFRGVRLSYALSDWIKLGAEYPPALSRLVEIRDAKTVRLSNGEKSRQLFQDVRSINEKLDESAATVELFKRLDALDPEFASRVYDLAEKSIVDAGDIGLAAKYLGDPLERFGKAKRNLSGSLEHARDSRNPEKMARASARLFSTEMNHVIRVVHEAGDISNAQKLQEMSQALLDNIEWFSDK